MQRSATRLGSSTQFAANATCKCLFFASCNCVYLPYCDGGSFSGHRVAPWPDGAAVRMTTMFTTPDNTLSGQRLHFRGLANLDATLDDLAETHGLGHATEVLVTGSSAGGLSAVLHVDRIARRVNAARAAAHPRATEPAVAVKVRGVPQVGAFLDHGNIRGDTHNYTT